MAPNHVVPEVSLQRRKELISTLVGFSKLPPPLQEELAKCLQVEVFPVGGVVVAERQMGDRMYVIADGVAEVSTEGPRGRVTLNQLSEGDMFGEVALVSKIRRRKATVTALTPLVALSLSANSFEKAMSSHPEVLKNFLKSAEAMMAEKLSKVSRAD